MKFNTKNIVIGMAVGSVIALAIYLIFFNKGKKTKLNKMKNKNPKSILFVGDSQTAIKNHANATPITYTYPNYIIDALKNKGISVDVLAKGGEPTSWMLKNLPEKLREKKFDRIYIQGGGNDAVNLVPYGKYKGNLEKMIDLGQQSGADVIFMTWFDRSKVSDPAKVPTTIYVPTKEEMYQRQKIYFDWQTKIGKDLENKANAIMPMFEIPKELVSDGIHPNSKGAKIIADLILKTI
jgi:lysophospholipase L1-like esterase